MRRNLILASALLMSGGILLAQAPASGAGSTTQSQATSPDTSKPTAAKRSTKADDLFAKKAAAGGLAEVELGQLATEKAEDPAVKAFGQRMVQDHTKANEQLKGVAGQENLQLPTEPMAKDKALKARLEKLSGAAFDRAYTNAMVTDHKKNIAEFQKEANNGKDDAIKNFASQTLPTLQDHLKQAQDAQLKVHSKTSTSAKSATAPKQ